MTPQRLQHETAILEKYHSGKYTIELLPQDDCIVRYKYKEDRFYTLIDMKEYPCKIPRVKLDYMKTPKLTFNPETSEFVKDRNLSEVDGLFYLYFALDEIFNPNWTFYKIIDLVNKWIDKDDAPIEFQPYFNMA